jgi:trans-aconitate 2-methyltransferase
MARAVIARLDLGGHETVLDAGCGSGRVTRLLLDELPEGRVIAVDQSPSMVEETRSALGDDPRVRVLPPTDLTDLPLDDQVDVVFSNAVFHWVRDHDALFARMHRALRPGGRLVAQCGGRGNVERFLAAAREVAEASPFAEHLLGYEGPQYFASDAETRDRLVGAGFDPADAWLEPHRVTVEQETFEYLRAICLGYHVERLPEAVRDDFVRAVAERCGEPLEVDYVRLNIVAVRPA